MRREPTRGSVGSNQRSNGLPRGSRETGNTRNAETQRVPGVAYAHQAPYRLHPPRRPIMKLLCSMSLVVALFASGCTEATAPGAPITALPRGLSSSETSLIAASNDFAF